MDLKIQIARVDLITTLKKFKKLCRPSPGEQAILSYSEGLLTITLGGMGHGCPASGKWPEQGRVLGNNLLALAKFPPKGDPIELSVEGENLRIGSTIMEAHWQKSNEKLIQLSMNPTLGELLVLKLKYTAEEILAAGHSETVEQAELECSCALEKAVEKLKQFHVNEEDLREVVDKCLIRQFP